MRGCICRPSGFGSGYNCWRCLDKWQRAGVWDELHALLHPRLRAAGETEWSPAVIDSSDVQAWRHPACRALRRLFGIGPITAVAFYAENR